MVVFRVKKRASHNKLGYVTNALSILKKILLVGQKLQQFLGTGRFCLLKELHRQGSAVNGYNIFVSPCNKKGTPSHLRETVPSLTSDMGQNTLSVLAHKFLLPQRAYSGYILSINPLRYSSS